MSSSNEDDLRRRIEILERCVLDLQMRCHDLEEIVYGVDEDDEPTDPKTSN